MNKEKFFLITLSIMFLIFAFSTLFIFNIGKISDVTIEKDSQYYLGEGEACSGVAIQLECDEGLICANRNNEVNFDPTEETGICIPIEKIN